MKYPRCTTCGKAIRKAPNKVPYIATEPTCSLCVFRKKRERTGRSRKETDFDRFIKALEEDENNK